MNLCSLWLILTLVLTSQLLFLQSRAFEILLGNWLEWSGWTPCTERVYCLEGSRQRQRQCEKDKRCIGIEEESEGCPSELCSDRMAFHDMVHAADHSFIKEECLSSVKYNIRGKYTSLMRHDVAEIFPKAKAVLDSSFFNVYVRRKKLPSEENIFKYCFEPKIKPTLDEFMFMFSTGPLRFKFTSIYCPLPKPQETKHVTGFVIGVQESGELYAIYAQVTAEKGFRSIHYRRMPGSYSPAYNLIW